MSDQGEGRGLEEMKKGVKREKERVVLKEKGKLSTTKTWLSDVIGKVSHLNRYGCHT